MRYDHFNVIGITLSAAFAVTAANTAFAASPFHAVEFSNGYMVAQSHEGKCGEGKCGADKNAEAAKTSGEGKCGEGKCGADKAAD
jgi:uncharacterized low-complexity protein